MRVIIAVMYVVVDIYVVVWPGQSSVPGSLFPFTDSSQAAFGFTFDLMAMLLSN